MGHPDQVKLRNEARVLKRKAVSSMRAAMAAFNSPLDDGRVTAVLLHLQHTFEMLMKAALVQQRTPGVFDKETGRSIGFARCLHEARSAARLKLTEEEAGTLRPRTPCATTNSTGSPSSTRASCTFTREPQ